jgi:hypothetical protein
VPLFFYLFDELTEWLKRRKELKKKPEIAADKDGDAPVGGEAQ